MNPITLPELVRVKTVPAKADVVVVPLTGDSEPAAVDLPTSVGRGYERKFGQSVVDMAKALGAKPKPGATTVVPGLNGQRLVVVGMGADEPTPKTVRKAAGAASRAVAGMKDVRTIAVALPADEPELLRAVVEGTLLGQYAYAPVTAEPADKPALEFSVVSTVADKSIIEQARVVAEAQLVAREWVNLPPNLLYPETFAGAAEDLVKGTKVKVQVLDEGDLTSGGFGGHMAVGGGSAQDPRLVRLSYAPARAKAHLVLVGKGITFDSGGLNLKPGESMSTMRCDMAGAAAVIAATHAIAQLGLNVQVTTYGCMAENLPSDTAFRPSDVLTIYGGTTVENYNTDAEGRLVLADGLARGAEDNPDLIVDVATLTGAAMVALGTEIFGVFSDSDEVAERVLGAAEAAGEEAWRLPMGEWSAKALESKVADLKSGGGRWGGASIAASFLRSFVDEEIDWAHLDIAPASFNEGSADGETPVGGTGVAVRTLVEIARSLQA
ncbi:leucyl aminopeptidase [Granulicoccus sp. GXG6511]|uniref:leucyl aminopeptidase n=1 Tax=Granulicoccus sp. GXG6511 TaxID=3381351 RepID=UPI003D7C454C